MKHKKKIFLKLFYLSILRWLAHNLFCKFRKKLHFIFKNWWPSKFYISIFGIFIKKIKPRNRLFSMMVHEMLYNDKGIDWPTVSSRTCVRKNEKKRRWKTDLTSKLLLLCFMLFHFWKHYLKNIVSRTKKFIDLELIKSSKIIIFINTLQCPCSLELKTIKQKFDVSYCNILCKKMLLSNDLHWVIWSQSLLHLALHSLESIWWIIFHFIFFFSLPPFLPLFFPSFLLSFFPCFSPSFPPCFSFSIKIITPECQYINTSFSENSRAVSVRGSFQNICLRCWSHSVGLQLLKKLSPVKLQFRF